MNRSISFVVAAASVGAALALFVACQSSDDPPTYTTKGGAAGAGQGGSANGGTAGTGNGGTAGTGNGGTGNGGTSNGGSAGTGGGTSCDVVGQDKTVEEIASGSVGSGLGVHFTAVAMTEPILAYTSKKKGSCLWAVFVKDPNKDVGTMVYNYGPNMETLADGGVGNCPANPVFAGLAAGDTLDVTGQTDPYKPTDCADAGLNPAEQMQIQVPKAECIKKTGSGAAPAPLVVTDLDALASGDAKYQGMLVQINNVTVVPWQQDGGTSVVGPFGVIKVQGATKVLEIHDKFYYSAEGAPQYGSVTTFNKIVGISHLDYCTWAIQPTHLCAGAFDPKPDNCP